MFLSNLTYATQRKVALVTRFPAAPVVQYMSDCLSLPSILSQNIIEKEFRKLLQNQEDITFEAYHQVGLVCLYQIQRSDLDAVFIFGHSGADQNKQILLDHTGLKDLQSAFQGLRAQTKFVGLCGCFSSHFLNDIKEIAPHVVAYGFKNHFLEHGNSTSKWLSISGILK